MKDQQRNATRGKATGGRTTRRKFVKGTAATAAGVSLFHIVPAHVLGGPGKTPPSETFGAALIGVGGRGPGTYSDLSKKHKLNIEGLAACDVNEHRLRDVKQRFGEKCEPYTDFRKLLERKDIDVVAIATPPHWHALISIAAMEAGKDVVCEKPMTRTIAEGRAVVKAAARTGRKYQIGTYGRFGMSGNDNNRQVRKMMLAGLAKGREVRYVHRGGLKVKQWSGRADIDPQPVPDHIDWDMYCGPSPLKPFHPPRIGGTHRWYWDYEGGGLCDMGQHKLDPLTWLFGKDVPDVGPVKVDVSAPPAHPEVSGMWAWVKFTYADGFELVLESGEWGEPTGLKSQGLRAEDLTAAERAALDKLPDPPKLHGFGDAVKDRSLEPGGNAEAAQRTCTLLHLANIAIRIGRGFAFDPVAERAVGDDYANRLIDQPMRAPWKLT